MKSSIRLGKIGGIEIGIHYTWILIFGLVSWSLAAGYLPQLYPGWTTLVYWVTGVIAALLLFVSVLIHELAHSFVARRRGMQVSSITLFLLGGVSNLEDEPEKPKAEFAMAIVGPLTSLVLAGIFWGFARLVSDSQSPLAAILEYLALINALLAGFNLLPGFPLDGGRVLRSILWGTTGDLVKATNIVSVIGQLLGWAIIAFGFFELLTGNFIGGIWFAFIGWFLTSSAGAGRREINLRQHLKNVKVKSIANIHTRTISPDTTVADMVTDIFRSHYGRAVPVCSDGRPLGIVTTTDVRELPQERWSETRVDQIMTREPLYTVNPDDDLYDALRMLAKHDINQVLVLQDGQCVGLLSRADILNHLHLSQELGISPQ
jgi:Zn-dependent protease/CBS domain-containing protein